MCEKNNNIKSLLLHGHTDVGSNLKLRDTTNTVEGLIQTTYDMGHNGVAITEHESISSSVRAIKTVEKLKKEKKISEDFKLVLGNEIYLVDSLEEVRDNYRGGGVTKFPHFLLLAKDSIGHEQIRYMSSRAWEQSFQTGLMLRTPTTKEFLKEVVNSNRGHLIGTSACLGSELCIRLLESKKFLEENNKTEARNSYKKCCNFVEWCIDIFGKDDFYLELQPAYSEEQIYCNKELLKLAEKYKLEYIVTTDSHYFRPEDRIVHKAFLNAKEGEREVDAFYEATFVQNHKEIYERLNYLDKKIIDKALENTVKIGDKIGEYNIIKDTVIPKINLPKFKIEGFFKSVYNKYEYINKMAHSDDEQDRYTIYLIEKGFKELLPYKTFTKEKLHEHAKRIDLELGELWNISLRFKQAMSSYYVTVSEIVKIIWDDSCDGGNSLVGASRGSAFGFLICYLMGITQISPLDYGISLPHWRHLTSTRPEIGDIDLDTEASKREQILRALKKHFGENRVLQVCTFGTEASKSAVQTAARGLGIDVDTAMYVSGLIKFERGSSWSLPDCVYGNEELEREPIEEFVKAINKHENWLNVAMKIEGLVNKRSSHASGIILFNEDYYKTNALMLSPNMSKTTQLSLEDCEAVSNVKFDLLTIEALDKIRVTLDNLLKDNIIDWQGSLKKTYEHYLHPQKIDIESKEVYDLIASNSVVDLFQFSTDIGIETVKKVKPSNLIELSAANSLMRLMGNKDQQTPIESFIKFKENINEWYNEMNRYGLNNEEIEILDRHLLALNGVADTQESVMLLSMDEKISGFDIVSANKLRKVIAKKKANEIEEVKKYFYKSGLELGTRKQLLDYVWNVQIERQLGYSFSILHTLAYSLIALQEVNLNINYDPIYWRTACLTVNSASMEEEDDEEDNKTQSTDYGKISIAISNMQQKGVKVGLPEINKAEFGFTPDVKNNQIIFGLKGMNGIGDEIAYTIINNRPYVSFEDFYKRMYKDGIIKNSHMYKLIKGGCFEEFGERHEIMKQFIELTTDVKSKLTMANLPSLIENNMIPSDFELEIRLFNFRKYVMKNNVYETETKDKLYLLDNTSLIFFEEYFSPECIVDYKNNFPIIKENKFKKEFDKKMENLKQWILLPETLIKFNEKLIENNWKSNASGTLSLWEMEAVSYYYTIHELSHVQKEKYKICNFFDLSEDSEILEMMYFKDSQRPKYKLSYIAGTVLHRNKNKHTVSLLTPEGVVNVKYYDGAFAHYNQQISRKLSDGKKEVVEKSWFNRGNKLVIQGYRRGSQFKPYKYKDSPNQHTTMLITEITDDGLLQVKRERTKL